MLLLNQVEFWEALKKCKSIILKETGLDMTNSKYQFGTFTPNFRKNEKK